MPFFSQFQLKYCCLSQGVSVQPFLALPRAHRSSIFYAQCTPHARVWLFSNSGAHRTQTSIFYKFYDGCRFMSKLVLKFENTTRFFIWMLTFSKMHVRVKHFKGRFISIQLVLKLRTHNFRPTYGPGK